MIKFTQYSQTRIMYVCVKIIRTKYSFLSGRQVSKVVFCPWSALFAACERSCCNLSNRKWKLHNSTCIHLDISYIILVHKTFSYFITSYIHVDNKILKKFHAKTPLGFLPRMYYMRGRVTLQKKLPPCLMIMCVCSPQIDRLVVIILCTYQ